MGSKRCLLVGDWRHEIYELALEKGFKDNDVKVERFEIGNYLSLDSFLGKLENFLSIGPRISKLNLKFQSSLSNNYDFVFFYRVRHISPRMITAVKKIYVDTKFIYFNNDDPFSKGYSRFYWRKSINLAIKCDLVYCYRKKNLFDFNKLNPTLKLKVLLPYYIKNKDLKLLVNKTNKSIDCIFIGHFENDGRDKTALYLQENGIDLIIKGRGWEGSELYTQLLKNQVEPIEPIKGPAYSRTLSESYIALVFLSKLNNDSYTRRNFEIPAAHTISITEKVANIEYDDLPLEQNKYFSSNDELLKMLQKLLTNKERLYNSGFLAQKELIEGRHEVADRALQILEDVKQLNLLTS